MAELIGRRCMSMGGRVLRADADKPVLGIARVELFLIGLFSLVYIDVLLFFSSNRQMKKEVIR